MISKLSREIKDKTHYGNKKWCRSVATKVNLVNKHNNENEMSRVATKCIKNEKVELQNVKMQKVDSKEKWKEQSARKTYTLSKK